MARVSAIALLVVIAVLAPSRAAAQVETFVITATPEPDVRAREAVQDEEDDDAEEDEAEAAAARARRPAVVQPDTPALREASWHRHVGVGASVGIGSPLGLAGVFIEATPHPWVGAFVGVGLGGAFGPAIAFGVDVHPWRFGRIAPYVGVGLSTNFTPSETRASPYLAAPVDSWWLDFEVGLEYRARNGVTARLGIGPAILLDTGDFTNLTFQGAYGAPINAEAGVDPVSAADAHDAGQALVTGYVHFDIAYELPY